MLGYFSGTAMFQINVELSLLSCLLQLASRTPYISDWSLYTPEPCLRIIRHCTDCDSSNDVSTMATKTCF